MSYYSNVAEISKETKAETVRQQVSAELYNRVLGAWAAEGRPGTVTEYLESCADRGLPPMFRRGTK